MSDHPRLRSALQDAVDALEAFYDYTPSEGLCRKMSFAITRGKEAIAEADASGLMGSYTAEQLLDISDELIEAVCRARSGDLLEKLDLFDFWETLMRAQLKGLGSDIEQTGW